MAHDARGWAPVIFGRTLRADSWWRAVPTGVAVDGWLAETVHAVVASGRELDDRPRFALARTARYLLVGVACMAAELSQEFNRDGSRPLYCFAGWLSDAGGGPEAGREPGVPRLEELRERYKEWAAPEYERYVRDVWTAHPIDVLKPVPTLPSAPPWPRAAAPRAETGPWHDEAPERLYFTSDEAPPAGSDAVSPASVPAVAPLRPQGGHIVLCPEREQDELWAAGLVTAEEFILITGWSSASDAVLADRGYVCVTNVRRRESRPVPAKDESRPVTVAEPMPPRREGLRQESAPRTPAEPIAAPDADVLSLRKVIKGGMARLLRRVAEELEEEQAEEEEHGVRTAPRRAELAPRPDARIPLWDDRPAADSQEGEQRARRSFGGFDE